LEAVAEGEALVTLMPGVGVTPFETRRALLRERDIRERNLVEEVLAAHREKVRRLGTRLLPPRLEGALVGDLGRQHEVVEAEDGLVVEQDVAAARALLDLGEFAAQSAIGAVKGDESFVEFRDVPFRLDEGAPDE